MSRAFYLRKELYGDRSAAILEKQAREAPPPPKEKPAPAKAAPAKKAATAKKKQ